MRKNYNLLVGEPTAEAIKIKIGSAAPTGDEREMEVKGRDLVSGIPKTVRVHSTEIREAVQEPIQQIVDAVRRALEITPPELASDIVDRGIVMTGGGALIRGLDLLLAQETGLPIHVDEDPLTCVVRGHRPDPGRLREIPQRTVVPEHGQHVRSPLHPPGHSAFHTLSRPLAVWALLAGRPGATAVADTLRETVLSPAGLAADPGRGGADQPGAFPPGHLGARLDRVPRPVPALAAGRERAAPPAAAAEPPARHRLRPGRSAASAAGHGWPHPAAERRRRDRVWRCSARWYRPKG